MPFPPPYEHHFTIDGERYTLVGWSLEGDNRIHLDYAMAIAPVPGVLDAIYGAHLYAQAVVRECLKEAPALFWETAPVPAGTNGAPARVVTLRHVSMALWDQLRPEVDAFVAQFRPAAAPLIGLAPDPGQTEPHAVAVAETVPAPHRVRAE